jgi:UDP-N-acetylbacillosamine N-acetyltransferase
MSGCSMKKTLVIYGCGGHSRSVADIVLANAEYESIFFVDDNAKENETLYGFRVLRQWTNEAADCFLAIGDNESRKRFLDNICEDYLISIISRTAHIGYQANIGKGVLIGNFCHIGPEASIGKNTIINNGAVVEHEVKVGEHCHVGPNATISGRCKIEELVFVGVGATIIDYVNICSNVIIGAGATVVRDIDEPGVYVGTPVRKIK